MGAYFAYMPVDISWPSLSQTRNGLTPRSSSATVTLAMTIPIRGKPSIGVVAGINLNRPSLGIDSRAKDLLLGCVRIRSMKVEGATWKQSSHRLNSMCIQTMSDLCKKELSSVSCQYVTEVSTSDGAYEMSKESNGSTIALRSGRCSRKGARVPTQRLYCIANRLNAAESNVWIMSWWKCQNFSVRHCISPVVKSVHEVNRQ